MAKRIGEHFRGNVVAYIALVFALGMGTAWALERNSVRSKHIVNGQVKTKDIGDGHVRASDIGAGAVNSSKVSDNSLTGTDINESSLGEVPSATLGGLGGDSSNVGGSCDPETTTFIACATVSTTVPAASRVLVIGQIRAEPDTGGGNGGGNCGVAGPVLRTIPVFVNGGQTDVIAISGITGVVGPGPVSFGVFCNEQASGIRYFDGSLSFVALSPSVAP